MWPIPPLVFELEVDDIDRLDVVEYDRLVAALRRGALYAGEWVRGTWVEVASTLNVRASGEYLRGIESAGTVRIASERLEAEGAVLEIVVEVTNNARHASFVEEGHGAFHLPDHINWSAAGGRIKRTKAGVPYIHVPFRHRAYAAAGTRERQGMTPATTRSMMPQEVYQRAKALTYTRKLGVGPIRREGGQWVAADRYAWGRRLDRSGTRPQFNMGGPGVGGGGPGEPGFEEHRGVRLIGRDRNGSPLINPAWGGSKFHGMFKSGAPGHSQYMTIRTLTRDSPGWNIPAVAGLYIGAKVAANAGTNPRLQELVRGTILAAMERP